jgi:hypothetical protein
MIIDSKYIYIIKYFANRSVDEVNTLFVSKGFFHIQRLYYNNIFASLIYFDSFHFAISLIPVNSILFYYINIKDTLLYKHLKKIFIFILLRVLGIVTKLYTRRGIYID